MQTGGSPEEQAAALQTARRRATGLLAVVAVFFLASFALPDEPWVGYLRAALEAGLVGGLADWFAVVALFRHPLGIPIPHTAVIPRSKTGLGANLASFVADNFLHTDQVTARLTDATHIERLGGWLREPEHAERVAARVATGLTALLDALDSDDVVGRATEQVRKRVRTVPVAQFAGDLLDESISEQRHTELVTATILGLRDAIGRNRGALRRRLGQQSPGWVPPLLDDLVYERAEDVARKFLRQIADDPNHELRKTFDLQMLALAGRLRTDEALAAQVSDAVDEALSEELITRYVETAWHQIRDEVRRAAGDDPDSEERTDLGISGLLVNALIELGRRMQEDADLQARILGMLEAAAPRLAMAGQDEVGSLIANTIDKWDAEETSRLLESWMGPDLQFVRINGTLVGALVGLVLHTLSELLT